MPILDALTGVIAGSKRVEASQRRATKRQYAGLEEKMRGMRNISPESVPEIASGYNSTLPSRTPSRATSRTPSLELEPKGRPPLSRPDLQRSQSELPMSARVPTAKPKFTPCITAMDLTPEQMKRTYSHDDLQKWDRAKSPLPPMCPMTGFGRYRTAIAADPQWRTEYLKRQASSFDGLAGMVAELDMSTMTGVPDEEWQQLAGAGARRDSAISSSSTGTASSSVLHESSIDPQSGVRIARGFSPPSASSTRSSFHSRKGSNLSIVSKATDVAPTLFQKPLQRQSTVHNGERRPSVPLFTINESQSNATETLKKPERPCDFTNKGDPDSAVTSDVEDGEEDAWSDEVEPERVSVIAQMLKDGKKPEPTFGLTRVRTTSNDKKRGRGSTTSIDRSKTVKALHTQVRRRKTSKNQFTTDHKTKSDEKKAELQMPELPTPESYEDGTELVMQLRKPSKEVATNDKKQNTAIKQTPTNTTDDHTIKAENQLEFLPRAPRNRSGTAVFCRNDVQKQAATLQPAV